MPLITSKSAPAPQDPVPIQARLDGLRRDRAAADSDLRATTEKHQALLLDGSEADVVKSGVALSAVRARIEMLDARIIKAEADLTEAKASEAQKVLWGAYNATKAASEKMKAELARRYPALFAEMVDLLSREAAIIEQINAANRKLPDGADPIGALEEFRHTPEIPKSRKTVSQMESVKKDQGSSLHSPGGQESYEKRMVTREVEVWGRPAHRPTALCQAVVLPPLRLGDPQFPPAPAVATLMRHG